MPPSSESSCVPACVLAMRSKALLVVREQSMYRCGMVNVMGLGFGFE